MKIALRQVLQLVVPCKICKTDTIIDCDVPRSSTVWLRLYHRNGRQRVIPVCHDCLGKMAQHPFPTVVKWEIEAR